MSGACFSLVRASSAEHAMRCFAMVVRAFLGEGAIANRKLEWGRWLVILGVEVHMSRDSYLLRPSRVKMAKCIAVMRSAIESGVLHAGAASKLAGRLSWATQHIFHRLGRAMIRPIYAQKRTRQALHSISSHMYVWCGCPLQGWPSVRHSSDGFALVGGGPGHGHCRREGLGV